MSLLPFLDTFGTMTSGKRRLQTDPRLLVDASQAHFGTKSDSDVPFGTTNSCPTPFAEKQPHTVTGSEYLTETTLSL